MDDGVLVQVRDQADDTWFDLGIASVRMDRDGHIDLELDLPEGQQMEVSDDWKYNETADAQERGRRAAFFDALLKHLDNPPPPTPEMKWIGDHYRPVNTFALRLIYEGRQWEFFRCILEAVSPIKLKPHFSEKNMGKALLPIVIQVLDNLRGRESMI